LAGLLKKVPSAPAYLFMQVPAWGKVPFYVTIPERLFNTNKIGEILWLDIPFQDYFNSFVP
jgi:hypothetical protein